MAIKYDKLVELMKANGITPYICKRDKVIGQASYYKILAGDNIDMRTLNNLCEYFTGKGVHVQPGDLLTYEPEEK